MALSSKNKLCFVDGSMKIPSRSDENYSDWERCNNTVLGWIQRSIDASIAQSILWIDYAKDAWNDLKDRFSQADIFRISDLQDDICKLEQGDRSVAQYFTELKILWDEVDNLIPLPRCTCQVQCSCGGYNIMRKIRDRDCVIRFLKGLNDQYEHISSKIMLVDPLPVVNKAFSMIIQQERKLSGTAPNHAADTTRAFTYASASKNATNTEKGKATFNKGSNNARGKGQQYCTHCKMTNHTIESCYFKHGFPPGYKSRRSVNQIATSGNGS
ncbi:uncharacterized protein LOC133316479 [Gastrolobium bilobum]|uniref:uncharacterized protein LOC133316479 n=1 Tax=Gastrolobium bilobum TaxID=150636 RepID=UPI002AB2898C|nr:uncharacterized protein LOC133316479 [Gastrolobium bilobum]